MPLDSITFAPAIVVSDLMAGRDYIVQNGWCQHASRDGLRVCLFGGIFAVTGGHASNGIIAGDTRRMAGVDALQRALESNLGAYRSGAAWNDEPGRTVDDVLEIYDLAIQRELA